MRFEILSQHTRGAELYVVYGVPRTHFLPVVKQLEDECIAGLQVDISWSSGIQRSYLTIGILAY